MAEQRDMTLEEFAGFTDRIVDEDGKVLGIIRGWMVADIRMVAVGSNYITTDEDAMNILKELDENYDPDIGINFDVIEEAIGIYFEDV